MRQYGRLLILFVAAVVLLLVLYVFRQASAPESAIIEKERNRMAAALDKDRVKKDQAYARDVEDKLRFLDLQQAEAYVKENKADEAIKLLQALIGAEESTSKAGPRRSTSYDKEAGYYEVLQTAYSQKNDKAGAERASDNRNKLREKAEAERKRERLSEGRSVGVNGE